MSGKPNRKRSKYLANHPDRRVWDVNLGQWIEPRRRVVLTDCEIAVLVARAAGLSSEESARKLGKSHKTVETQMTTLKRKLGARTEAQLGVYALASGFVDAHGNDLTLDRNNSVIRGRGRSSNRESTAAGREPGANTIDRVDALSR